jgi:hypothetical protein
MGDILVPATVRIRNKFYDFNSTTGTNELVDPSSVDVTFEKWNGTAYVSWGTPATAVREGAGIFYYDWVTSENGKFKIIFTGTIGFGQIVIPRYIYVGPMSSSTDLQRLGADYEFDFNGLLDPLFIDPEEIAIYYPEVDKSQIAEYTHLFSLEVENLFGKGKPITGAAEDYIIASVLCTLTRIYGAPTSGTFASSDSGDFTLGDLHVKGSSSSSSTATSVNRGTAGNWCELAAILRQELYRGRTTMRVVMRGAQVCDYRSDRRLKSLDNHPRRFFPRDRVY